jgi:transcriptional regulator with XRE-family HTH domain
MPRRNSRAEGPHEIDVHVGKVVAERRKSLGLTQADLGKAIGVTFQQVQKYERGSNRMSASILFQIAQTLEIHPGDFFPKVGQSAPILDSPPISRASLEIARLAPHLPTNAKKIVLATIRALLPGGR